MPLVLGGDVVEIYLLKTKYGLVLLSNQQGKPGEVFTRIQQQVLKTYFLKRNCFNVSRNH